MAYAQCNKEGVKHCQITCLPLPMINTLENNSSTEEISELLFFIESCMVGVVLSDYRLVKPVVPMER
eukprot:4380481-Amphidinium_carterae.1